MIVAGDDHLGVRFQGAFENAMIVRVDAVGNRLLRDDWVRQSP